MIKKIFLIFIILAMLLVGIYFFWPKSSEPKDFECESYLDCVPVECCHATGCIHKNYAPDCSDVTCTLECQPNTLDCNQGYCDCTNEICVAIFGNELV